MFNIYLDENNSVLRISYLNDDAEKLFADIDVVGMTYQEAMPVILNTAEDGNITKEVVLLYQDEVWTERLYYENGGIKKYIWDFPDGCHEEQSFDENGNPIDE